MFSQLNYLTVERVYCPMMFLAVAIQPRGIDVAFQFSLQEGNSQEEVRNQIRQKRGEDFSFELAPVGDWAAFSLPVAKKAVVIVQ